MVSLLLFVARIAKGYAPVPERLTKTATFQLGHPKVGLLTFGAEGQLVEHKPGREGRERSSAGAEAPRHVSAPGRRTAGCGR